MIQMQVIGRNKKCLFLGYSAGAADRKRHGKQACRKSIFKQTKCECFWLVMKLSGDYHAAYIWTALSLASRCMHMPMSMIQKEK